MPFNLKFDINKLMELGWVVMDSSRPLYLKGDCELVICPTTLTEEFIQRQVASAIDKLGPMCYGLAQQQMTEAYMQAHFIDALVRARIPEAV